MYLRFSGKILLMSLLVVILVGLFIFSSDDKEQIKELRAVELPITYSAVTHIANKNGYIAEQNLTYRAISVPAGPDIITALRGNDSADVSSIAVTPIVVMIGAGDHPVVLATGLKSNQRVQLATFKDSGISDNPFTIKGKKIGYVKSTVGEIYLSRLLTKANLSENDVVLVNGRPSDIVSLLLRGDLDAALLWDPFISQIERKGKVLQNQRGEVQVYVDSSLYTLTFNIVTTKKKLDKYRDELVKFLRACVKAGDFIDSNLKKSQHMLEEWLNLQSGDLDHFIRTTDFKVHLDVPDIKKDMREELRWLKSRRVDTIIPKDLSKYIDSSLLKEIDSSLVFE